MRGEDVFPLLSYRKRAETPPRAWGRHLASSFHARGPRNTPTCVGKTPPTVQEKYFLKKHPHVRGEDPIRHKSTFDKIGNTPTCVGKTNSVLSVCGIMAKHPHVRGEDVYSDSDLAHNKETPPRAWGRLHTLHGKASYFRNTPTCVGKTGFHPSRTSYVKKHPHVRGEDTYL